MMHTRYFDKQGRRITITEWAKLVIDHDYKFVAFDAGKRYRVSTVWIGADKSPVRETPLIFQSIVFEGSGHAEIASGLYSTEAEALAGHQKLATTYVPVVESLAELATTLDVPTPERGTMTPRKRASEDARARRRRSRHRR